MLYQKVYADLIQAMKTKNTRRIKVLRFLKSQLDMVAKAKRARLTDEEAIAVIRKRIKQSREARGQYQAGGRPELAAEEQKEIELVSGYLPVLPSSEELDRLVQKLIDGMGGATQKDFGKVMGLVVRELKGKADGKTIRVAVERRLLKK